MMQYLILSALAFRYVGGVAAAVIMCNPLNITQACSPNPALGCTFSASLREPSEMFSLYSNAGEVTYGEEGVSFTITKRFENPAIMSNYYIMYGKVEVELKAAEGTGIVSSFYLQSDAQDEIDFEWLGGDTTQVQTNFFSKGDITTYTRGAFHNVLEPQKEFHRYTIDWRMDETTWYIDDEPIRTLRNNTSEGYPQTPMRVYMGVWAGGDPTNAPGTVQWAGGLTDFTKVPFTSTVRNVIITDYSTGETYTYSDKTGSWTSIVAGGGIIYERFEEAQEEFEESRDELQEEDSDENIDELDEDDDENTDVISSNNVLLTVFDTKITSIPSNRSSVAQTHLPVTSVIQFVNHSVSLVSSVTSTGQNVLSPQTRSAEPTGPSSSAIQTIASHNSSPNKLITLTFWNTLVTLGSLLFL